MLTTVTILKPRKIHLPLAMAMERSREVHLKRRDNISRRGLKNLKSSIITRKSPRMLRKTNAVLLLENQSEQEQSSIPLRTTKYIII